MSLLSVRNIHRDWGNWPITARGYARTTLRVWRYNITEMVRGCILRVRQRPKNIFTWVRKYGSAGTSRDHTERDARVFVIEHGVALVVDYLSVLWRSNMTKNIYLISRKIIIEGYIIINYIYSSRWWAWIYVNVSLIINVAIINERGVVEIYNRRYVLHFLLASHGHNDIRGRNGMNAPCYPYAHTSDPSHDRSGEYYTYLHWRVMHRTRAGVRLASKRWASLAT